jgi:hypothetical protein
LARPLLAALVGGALLAGGAVATSPAYADPAASDAASTADQTSASPSADTSAGPASPSADTSAGPGAPSAGPADTSAGPGDTSPEPSTGPDPDTTAPTGTFALNLASIWIGQSVTVTQAESQYSDDKDANAAITRVIDFGDGTATVTLAPGVASAPHQYVRFGNFKITETLKDSSGNASTIVKPVAVTLPGKTSVSTHSVWLGQRYTFKITNVPTGTLAIKVNWGDGFISAHAGKNQTITGYYYKDKSGNLVTGTRQTLIQYRNKNGYSSWINAGSITIKKDIWKPVVKITKPSSPNRVKSWKTVKGTVTDKGSGAPYAYVWITRVASGKVYCFTAKKKWIRVNSEAEYDAKCTPQSLKVVKSKWSFKLPGLAKGQLYIDALAYDWQDHEGWRSLHVNVTRS